MPISFFHHDDDDDDGRQKLGLTIFIDLLSLLMFAMACM